MQSLVTCESGGLGVRSAAREYACGVELALRVRPPPDHLHEFPRHGRHRLCPFHLLHSGFAMVVLAVQATAPDQRQHQLVQNAPELRPPLSGDLRLADIFAALPLAEIESAVAETWRQLA